MTLLKHRSYIRLTILLLLLSPDTCLTYDLLGQSLRQLQKDAGTYFESGDFRTALDLYRQAGLENSQNKNIRLRIGISMYEINDVESASKIFQSLIREGKTEALVFYYMAKVLQSKSLFSEAIAQYKKFLQRTKPDDPLRIWVKDELTRCANGLRLKYAEQEAYVENAGTSLNTQDAEFGVRYSPTNIDRIYFNSDRFKSTDIYSSSLEDGRWSMPKALPSSVNTEFYDEVAGFSTSGNILYFLSQAGNQYRIKTDTFSGSDQLVFQGVFKGPYDPHGEGTDLTFFNDTISLFAAEFPEGYGGYDLYISLLKNGQWTEPVNLGPTINTFYDERFPFLTRNGLTLFYSSNNLESTGGMDIFRSVFNVETLTWSVPENLGFPVNSSLDDTHLVLAPDAMSAFISSDRKAGYGDYDLYRVFFKQPVQAHQEISYVPTFYQTMMMSGLETASVNIPEKPVEVKEYFISHLFIDENGNVLTPQNLKKLDLLANLLLIYPKIKAELSTFEVPKSQKIFDLYFSIKKSEQAAEYLVKKGVSRNRLILKGYGASFPLALNTSGQTANPVYLKLNHRLEIGLHDFEKEPVITHIEKIPVPDNLLDPKGIKFSVYRQGFYYSVQIASVTQILQNPNLEKLEELFIEVNNTQGNYRYMVGILKTFAEAESVRQEMVKLGYNDAFIVPFKKGIRLDRPDVLTHAEEYPDFLNYLNGVKE